MIALLYYWWSTVYSLQSTEPGSEMCRTGPLCPLCRHTLCIVTDRIWHLYLAAQEIKELWLEYEDCTSEEARVVKDFDKLEMIVQADEYERGEPQRRLQ